VNLACRGALHSAAQTTLSHGASAPRKPSWAKRCWKRKGGDGPSCGRTDGG